MTRGFYIILAAQFFSALADNALLIAAITLLAELRAPAEYTPVLRQFFVVSYVVLAPFVGPFADALPKGKVMFISNAVKLAGCGAMLIGMHPLFAYGIAGIGAAMYSPAKYGILTEYLPPKQLVIANAWMEGLTVAAIVLGAVVGGLLVKPQYAQGALALLGLTGWSISLFAIAVITSFYLIAAWFNLYIPRVAIDHPMPKTNPLFILHDFWHCFKLLWRDPLGQVTLAVTSLFWGVGSTLQLIVLAWAAASMKFDMAQATQLSVAVPAGIAIGSVMAAKYVSLDKSVKVLPVGIAMGAVVITMIFVADWRVAAALLLVIGIMAGFFVVPMNALLQHRGHLLMGAGHSIAVQNFNENISILILSGAYALMIREKLTIYTIILTFGVFVSVVMAYLYKKHAQDKDPTLH
jgi:MFS transporter, LPLT family, lysophospholipid transporter